MMKGTKVKILQPGKEEVIDGIKSCWVQVEVQAGVTVDFWSNRYSYQYEFAWIPLLFVKFPENKLHFQQELR